MESRLEAPAHRSRMGRVEIRVESVPARQIQLDRFRASDEGEATVGIGGGQPNRVDCVRIATERAGEKSIGAVMASDAFFPFPDSVEVAAKPALPPSPTPADRT